MKRTLLIIGALALVTTPSFAMSDTECTAEWTKADINKDGSLSGAEADRYLAAMRVSDKTPPNDGRLTDAIFMENCKAGMFSAAKVEAGAPLTGANSFTEGQAKDRATAAGLTGVSALKKDDNGIWRGQAKRGDADVSVAVDFKGNVVAK